MNILFLDDCPYRAKKFKAEFPTAKVVTTAKECIDELQAHSWDAVFLDHDLNGSHYQDPTEENCGTTVAVWICDNKPQIDRVVVHSLNEIERGKMVEMLRKEAYYVINCSFLRLLSQVDSIRKEICISDS